jgi:hypothetical protein
MNAAQACRYFIAISLIGMAIPASASVVRASNESSEARKPPTAGRVTPDGATQGTAPAGKARAAPMPPNRAQEVEERVRSGQMERPIAQGDISDRLNQLESGLSTSSDQTSRTHSPP